MSLLKFPKMYEELSNSKALVMEYIKDPTVSSLVKSQSISWEHVLNLFRIHGAFMFGVEHSMEIYTLETLCFQMMVNLLSSTLVQYVTRQKGYPIPFGFFFNLAKYQKKDAYDALLQMSDVPPTGKN